MPRSNMIGDEGTGMWRMRGNPERMEGVSEM